jgi:predicted membrane channel-forming protein YqfA (hemolysin III family)
MMNVESSAKLPPNEAKILYGSKQIQLTPATTTFAIFTLGQLVLFIMSITYETFASASILTHISSPTTPA